MARSRKAVTVPTTQENVVTEPTTDTTTETQAPEHGVNATAAEIAADELREHLIANAAAITEALNSADETQKGDVNGTAYIKAKSAIDLLDMTADHFARWKPGSGDAIDKVVTEIHNTTRPQAGPAVRSLRAAALHLAVLATAKDTAEAARRGDGTDESPQYNFVRVRTFPGEKTTDERLKGITKQDEALARLNKLVKEAQDPQEAAVYQEAIAAVDNQERLRRLGNAVSSLSMDASRWRKWLYVPLITEHLDAFVTQNEGNKTLGQVWVKALAKAQEAHVKIITASRKTGDDADVGALKAEVEKQVWDEYLSQLTSIGRVIKEKTVNRDKMVDAFFAKAEELGRELGTNLVEKIVTAYSDAIYRTIGDGELAYYLGQSPAKRKEGEVAAKRQQEQAAEQQRQQTVQQTADTQAQVAREQRQAQRTAQQTGQAPSGNATAPRRRAVVTPAADGAATNPVLAGLKKRNS